MRFTAVVVTLCFALQAAAQDAPKKASLVPSTSAPPLVATPEGVASVDDVPLYRRWYVWVGAGAATVVVAAVVGGVVMVATNGSGGSSPTKGAPPPPMTTNPSAPNGGPL